MYKKMADSMTLTQLSSILRTYGNYNGFPNLTCEPSTTDRFMQQIREQYPAIAEATIAKVTEICEKIADLKVIIGPSTDDSSPNSQGIIIMCTILCILAFMSCSGNPVRRGRGGKRRKSRQNKKRRTVKQR
jgi:hypothetical protein